MELSVTIVLTTDQLTELAERVAEILSEQREPSLLPTWLNAKGAAQYLDCPISRIYDLVQLGQLDPERDGRRLLFERSELDRFIKSGGARLENPRNGRRRAA